MRRNKYPNRQRRGAVLVLSALFMVVILGMVAFAVDLLGLRTAPLVAALGAALRGGGMVIPFVALGAFTPT